MMKKIEKMTETLAHEYSAESTQRELSNEYQHDRVQNVFKIICILVGLEERSLNVAEKLKIKIPTQTKQMKTGT